MGVFVALAESHGSHLKAIRKPFESQPGGPARSVCKRVFKARKSPKALKAVVGFLMCEVTRYSTRRRNAHRTRRNYSQYLKGQSGKGAISSSGRAPGPVNGTTYPGGPVMEAKTPTRKDKTKILGIGDVGPDRSGLNIRVGKYM